MNRVCRVCECEFDDSSPAKRRAGGKITDCSDCAEESTVRYLGLQAADGKQSQVTILGFKSTQDREKYKKFWQNNSGYNKGKSCQLGSHLSTDPGIAFQTRNAFAPTNHKGKCA